jgi:hypothetical protein
VAPGVAVALGELDAGVGLVQDAVARELALVDDAVAVLVGRLVGDVVGLGVDDLAVSGGDVPEETVVDGTGRGRSGRLVAPAEQGQLLLDPSFPRTV